MTDARMPYDQRLARILVRPLTGTALRPNHVTVLSALVALTGAGLLATGDTVLMNWGAGLFVVGRFLDHFDGELARQTGRTSRIGYLLDYFVGGLSYAALFAGLGWGLQQQLHHWVFVFGLLGCASAMAAVVVNIQIDKARGGDDAVGYPALAGFELEDGIYLLAPVAWLGWLAPFYVAACLGAGVYLLYSTLVLIRALSAR